MKKTVLGLFYVLKNWTPCIIQNFHIDSPSCGMENVMGAVRAASEDEDDLATATEDDSTAAEDDLLRTGCVQV